MLLFCKMRSSLSKKLRELKLKSPQSLTKSQYSWYAVAIVDERTTITSQNGVGSTAYFHLTAAASMAEMYFPAFARWFTSYPSSMYLLAHWELWKENSNVSPQINFIEHPYERRLAQMVIWLPALHANSREGRILHRPTTCTCCSLYKSHICWSWSSQAWKNML